MKLYLVQHGEAFPEAASPEKSLSPRGSADVLNLARACAAHHVKAQEIIHSGKARAAQTAEMLGEALGLKARAVAGLDPLDPVMPFADLCEAMIEPKIVVGHLPFMERLAAFLVKGQEEPPVVAFQRGGMVCIEKRGPREWCILWTFFPNQPQKGN